MKITSTTKEFLDLISLSEKRGNLLLYLKTGPKTLDQIKEAIEDTSSGLIPQIRKIEAKNLVYQDGRDYALTKTGEIVAEQFQNLINTIEVIETDEEFWLEHDLDPIPWHLRSRIFELGKCRFIDHPSESIYDPHKQFFDNILKSKWVNGISPVFHPYYPEFFLKIAESGMQANIILTKKVFDRVKKEEREKLRGYLKMENARMFVSEKDIKLACAVTDVFFSLSLFLNTGLYDSKSDLVSFEPSAIGWGKELFDHYMARSEEIKEV